MSLISIIMPYYKKKDYLKDSISSILNQSYQKFEIILIDDEVTEESIFFLKEISKLDKRIQILSNEKNLGVGKSRNRAIEISKGEFIAFCDCDDLWKKTKLEKQIKHMKNYNLDFSYTSYDIIDENNIVKGIRKVEFEIDFNKLLNSCNIGLSTVLVSKNIFLNKEYRFAEIKTKEDYVLWLILAKDGVKMVALDEILSSWRKSKNSLSSSIFQKLLDGYRVYRIYLKYSRIKSLFCLIKLSINYILKQ